MEAIGEGKSDPESSDLGASHTERKRVGDTGGWGRTLDGKLSDQGRSLFRV